MLLGPNSFHGKDRNRGHEEDTQKLLKSKFEKSIKTLTNSHVIGQSKSNRQTKMVRNGKAYLKGEGANFGINNSVYCTVIIKKENKPKIRNNKKITSLECGIRREER